MVCGDARTKQRERGLVGGTGVGERTPASSAPSMVDFQAWGVRKRAPVADPGYLGGTGGGKRWLAFVSEGGCKEN